MSDEIKIWYLLDPELNQNIGNLNQKVRIALWQNQDIQIGGSYQELVEKYFYDNLTTENSTLKKRLEEAVYALRGLWKVSSCECHELYDEKEKDGGLCCAICRAKKCLDQDDKLAGDE